MIVLARYLSGSHAYGLNDENSDVDERGVVIQDDPSYIVGLKKFEHKTIQNSKEDSSYRELRSYLVLLSKSNTESIEALYHDDFIEIHPVFERLRGCRYKLMDSEMLFKCLKGYMHGERSRVFGEVTGKLGDKRKLALEKYGYSYRNLVHYIRLAFAGITFFKHSIYPVRMNPWPVYLLLKRIKDNPHLLSFEELKINAILDEYEELLEESYKNRSVTYKFDFDFANDFCCSVYKDVLNGKI